MEEAARCRLVRALLRADRRTRPALALRYILYGEEEARRQLEADYRRHLREALYVVLPNHDCVTKVLRVEDAGLPEVPQ